MPTSTRQLRSLVTPADDGAGEVRLSIEETELPDPRSHQLLIEVEAAPINPSDLGLLLAMADVEQATAGGTPESPEITAPISPKVMPALQARVGRSMPVGNEGAGTVIAAGDSPEAQALVGRRVAFLGDGTYADHALTALQMVLPLPDGATAAQGASSFVNPLTALGFVETMRREGYSAIVHTAAASNLGQMLNRICLADGVPLVNIVRKPEQADLLRDQGATYVVDSSTDSFFPDLVAALKATGATLAFDAVGGGDLASTILNAMEAAHTDPDAPYSRYGTDVWKQVYVYGALDRRPIELRRGFGFAWGVGGWLLTPFLAKLAPEDHMRLRTRVADELTTTFASTYTNQIGLTEALDLDVLRQYARMATGQKYLIAP
jgi:NADPH:quinone reductase-like Zn-dependent oxidoreductase